MKRFWRFLLRILGLRYEILPDENCIQSNKPVNQTITPNQILFAYRDFKVTGKWYYVHPTTKEKIYGGELFTETVKYKTKDGKIKLGQRIIPDNDKHVTGFEPTPPEFL